MWLFYALLASILWGLTYTLEGRLLISVSPISFITYKMILGCLVFVSIGMRGKLLDDGLLVLNNKKLLLLLISTSIISFIAEFCIYKSIVSKNPVLTAVIETCYPVFTVFFSWLLFKTNLFNIPTIIGTLFIFIGIYFVSHG